jgi:hypothetical protein
MKSRIYKGKKYVYSVPKAKNYVGMLEIQVEHIHIHAMRLIDGSYATHFLPYLHYDSAESLTESVIDNVPFFRTSRKTE